MKLSARRLQAYGWLLINVVAWGATVPIVKWGLGETTPFRFLLYRFAIGALLSLPIFWHYRKFIISKTFLMLQSVGIELVGTTIALGILYVGLSRTSALEASLISNTGPVFITLGGLLFLRERVTKREWLGLCIATGMTLVLTILPDLILGQSLILGHFKGNALIFLQNIANVVYFLLAKRIYHTIPKLLVTAISISVGVVSFAILSFIEASYRWDMLRLAINQDLGHPQVWVIAFFAAIITSIVGLTAYIKGQDLIEASEASLFNYLQPIVYIPLSIMLLGEVIQPIQLLLFMGALVGVAIASYKPSRKVKKNKVIKYAVAQRSHLRHGQIRGSKRAR